LQDICKIVKKLANLTILSTQTHTPQLGLFHGLADQLDQKHPLYQIANKINWTFFTVMLFKSITVKKWESQASPSGLWYHC
jgi:hypothetical protein